MKFFFIVIVALLVGSNKEHTLSHYLRIYCDKSERVLEYIRMLLHHVLHTLYLEEVVGLTPRIYVKNFIFKLR